MPSSPVAALPLAVVDHVGDEREETGGGGDASDGADESAGDHEGDVARVDERDEDADDRDDDADQDELALAEAGDEPRA